MKIEVRIIRDDETQPLQKGQERVIHVETHAKRNDSFTIQRVDDVVETGDGKATFTVPNGGRLVINTPLTHEEVVYDPNQAAAIRPSQQRLEPDRADPPVQGTDTRTRVGDTKPDASAIEKAEAQRKAQDAVAKGASTGQVNPTAAAQAQQNAPRPPGEKAPLPGSPVGSPPHGNEGKK